MAKFEKFGYRYTGGRRVSARLRPRLADFKAAFTMDQSDAIHPYFKPNEEQLQHDIRKFERMKKEKKEEQSKEDEKSNIENLPQNDEINNDEIACIYDWYPIDKIFSLRMADDSEIEKFNTSVVADIHCYGDSIDTETVYDPRKLGKAYEKDGILTFWKKTNEEAYSVLMDENKVTFDPRSVIDGPALAYAVGTDGSRQWGVATPLAHTFDAFTWHVDLIKGFEFEEMRRDVFAQQEQLVAVNENKNKKLLCLRNMIVITTMDDETAVKQERIDILLDVNNKLIERCKDTSKWQQDSRTLLQSFGTRIIRSLRDGIESKAHEGSVYSWGFNNGMKPLFAALGLRFIKRKQDSKSLEKKGKIVYCNVGIGHMVALVGVSMQRNRKNKGWKVRNATFEYHYKTSKFRVEYHVCVLNKGQQQPVA